MKTKVTVEGMSCEHCVKAVSSAIKEVQGVHKAEVNLKSKTAEIEHSETVTLESLKTAIEQAGFTAL
ncbi:MAG: cation transporter [Spirochaetaceae bacterium]|jgi:Cu+-exporting ATPase|nr:cation transporter [Spirochaetaceae bacterium]